LAGAGIKIPIGDYKIEDTDEAHERNHKPGTGSWDVLLSMVYLGKINKTGWNINVTYLIANSNSRHFQFGNKFNMNVTAYQQTRLKGAMLFPNIGLYYEQSAKEWDKSYYIQNSGGSITYAHAGLDVYYKRISVNTAFQLPFLRSLNGYQAEIKYRIITGITYAIN
jgi:hypothetical protein